MTMSLVAITALFIRRRSRHAPKLTPTNLGAEPDRRPDGGERVDELAPAASSGLSAPPAAGSMTALWPDLASSAMLAGVGHRLAMIEAKIQSAHLQDYYDPGYNLNMLPLPAPLPPPMHMQPPNAALLRAAALQHQHAALAMSSTIRSIREPSGPQSGASCRGVSVSNDVDHINDINDVQAMPSSGQAQSGGRVPTQPAAQQWV